MQVILATLQIVNKKRNFFIKNRLHFLIVYGIVVLVRIQTMAKEWGNPLFCVYYFP